MNELLCLLEQHVLAEVITQSERDHEKGLLRLSQAVAVLDA